MTKHICIAAFALAFTALAEDPAPQIPTDDQLIENILDGLDVPELRTIENDARAAARQSRYCRGCSPPMDSRPTNRALATTTCWDLPRTKVPKLTKPSRIIYRRSIKDC